MNGWVLVYYPGDMVYQMLQGPEKHEDYKTRLARKGLKTVITMIQVWWYFRA